MGLEGRALLAERTLGHTQTLLATEKQRVNEYCGKLNIKDEILDAARASLNDYSSRLKKLEVENAALVTEVEKLRAERDRLAAENMAMIRLLTDISDNHVEYFSEGEGTMFAGVPLDYVSEINMYVSRDVNAENPFPATDRIVAGIKADGVAPLVSALKVIANSEQHNGDTVVCDFDTLISVAACALRDYYAMQLREGADK
nr:hypothetical protein [Klebsiella michiganensis]